MRSLTMIFFLFLSIPLLANEILTQENLQEEITQVLQSNGNAEKKKAYEAFIASLEQSKQKIASLPDEEYEAHQTINTILIELSQYLSEKIQFNQTAQCSQQQILSESQKSQQQLEEFSQSTTKNVVNAMINHICQ